MDENSRQSPGEARRRALKKLLARDRSQQELCQLLRKEGFGEEQIRDAVEYARSFGYVNDRRYAENYVMSAGKKKSRSAMRSFLQEKGVSPEHIEEALSGLPEEEGEVIRQLLLKKAGAPHPMEEKELRRVFAYLARRGFAGNDIWRELKNFQETSGYTD